MKYWYRCVENAILEVCDGDAPVPHSPRAAEPARDWDGGSGRSGPDGKLESVQRM